MIFRKTILILLSSICLVFASLPVIPSTSYARQIDTNYYGPSNPKGMFIYSTESGYKFTTVFMNRTKAKEYARKLTTIGSEKDQIGDYAISIAVGRYNPALGTVLGFASFFDGLNNRYTADKIYELLKKNNGVYIESLKANGMVPTGSQRIGGWNGKASSAITESRSGGFTIKKIVFD
jgi:hypothetical protein